MGRGPPISPSSGQLSCGRVAQPFGFCPHRSGRAAFPHPALPGGNPPHAVRAAQGWMIRGSGRGKRSSIAVKRSRVRFRASGCAAAGSAARSVGNALSARELFGSPHSKRSGRVGCWRTSVAARPLAHACAARPPRRGAVSLRVRRLLCGLVLDDEPAIPCPPAIMGESRERRKFPDAAHRVADVARPAAGRTRSAASCPHGALGQTWPAGP